ncbi:MAG: alcohol dehydrogenase catalytic domain-containing protein [Gemmatimonadetes bacterium]|nr:alcohol dehydrogenase catalytic domain-containing protein [Gemmatimonadota bacterium]
MRAVTFDVSVARYLMARSVGRVSDAVLYGRPSGVALREMEPPPLPGPRWVRLEVLLGGICGTDIGNLTYSASPAMEPFGSFPSVPGHEILARVVETGAGVRGIEAGQRVVVDPMVGCEVRGVPEGERCASCRAGLPSTCAFAGEAGPQTVAGEPMAPGVTIGYHRSLPGGWGEAMVAHESQIHAVDDALDDRAAVLIEPLAVGMHAVLNARPRAGEPVLVIGSGPIALATVWALRASGFEGELMAQMKRRHESDLARRLGASDVVSPGDEARDALVATGAQAYMPLVGPEVYAGGGFPLIFDCVGSGVSLEQALRFATPRGRIVLLGCAAQIPKLDLTFLWARELDLKGFVGYGRERREEGDAHTFRITQDRLLQSGGAVADMVTHVYPLEQYRDALGAAGNRRRSGSIKVLLDPRMGSSA